MANATFEKDLMDTLKYEENLKTNPLEEVMMDAIKREEESRKLPE